MADQTPLVPPGLLFGAIVTIYFSAMKLRNKTVVTYVSIKKYRHVKLSTFCVSLNCVIALLMVWFLVPLPNLQDFAFYPKILGLVKV